MALSGKDLETFQLNRIDKIRKHIWDTWDKPSNSYEAYAYLFGEVLTDVRKDFVSGTVFYKNPFGEQVPVENDLDIFKSFAASCGMSVKNLQAHFYRYLQLLTPRWLVDIPEWDGVDRVRSLCQSCEVENVSLECFYQHILAWGAGVFGRAYNPSFQNKVVIFRGPQGIGKDFFIKTLCRSLGPYFGTWTNTRDERELILLMERSLVLNVPEFDNTHKNEIAMLKALITKYQATYRAPYARKAQTVDLRTSFISSANVEYLLRDSTGNRRYAIFVVNKFGLIKEFEGFDSLQVLAQFKNAYERGFTVSDESAETMRAYIESQTPPSYEDQVIEAWNAEVKAYCRLSQARVTDWIPAHLVTGIFEKLKKEYGIGRNHLTVLLANRGCRHRSRGGTFYKGMETLSVAKTE